MAINNLPNRKYQLKKAASTSALNIAVILAMMILTVIALVAYFDADTLIPGLHTPLIIVIIGLAVIAYYIKVPPPYVKLLDGEIKVRKYIFGGWKTASLRNLQAAEVRGDSLYLAFSDEQNSEIEIKLDAMNLTDAQELQELIKNISSE